MFREEALWVTLALGAVKEPSGDTAKMDLCLCGVIEEHQIFLTQYCAMRSVSHMTHVTHITHITLMQLSKECLHVFTFRHSDI